MITIILPISRTDFLRPVFECLKNLNKPDDTELLIITDGDESLEQAVDKRLDTISFAKVQVISYGEKPATTINERRYRIADIHNKAKHYVSEIAHYVFCIEDDTTYPADTLVKLRKTANSIRSLAFIEGVQLGRHNSPYVGAWSVDDNEDPKEITSMLPKDKEPLCRFNGTQEITAGGLYCALIGAEQYKAHQFEPFDREGTNGLSCDFNFGLSLTRDGWICAIDWRIQTDHIGDKGSVNLGNTKPCQLRFKKGEDDKWVCIRV